MLDGHHILECPVKSMNITNPHYSTKIKFRPEIFTDELDCLQVVTEPWSFHGVPN
ncbi:hypothetical protein HanPSC8_Chr16g0697781 [Helianthus annuus]|nr:hypothetical protein HanPSC8_Chr16g0697781 [Helianthus annuus]